MSHFYCSGNLVDLKVLPQTLLEKVQQFGDKFKLMLEAKVVKVEQDNDKVMMMLFMIVIVVMLRMILGKPRRSKGDEFPERLQTVCDSPPSSFFVEIFPEIYDWFIIHKIRNELFWIRNDLLQSFSRNSSILEYPGLPYQSS